MSRTAPTRQSCGRTGCGSSTKSARRRGRWLTFRRSKGMSPSPRRGEGRGEHLCWKSSMFWRLRHPDSVLADEGIGEDGELSGDGDDDELWGFSGSGHPKVESFHVSV